MPGEPAAERDGSPTIAAVPAAAAADRPNPETVYHVRVIHPWTDEVEAKAEGSAAPSYSFFGLELELTGCRVRDEASTTPVSLPLHFGKAVSPGDADVLAALVPPFQIRVAGKMAPPDVVAASNKLVLQRFVAVQPENALLEINGVRFLLVCATGAQVHQCLLRVLTKASMATPFEVTFQRHNHTQAAAKIVPFATRADVQVAQVAQYQAMQTREAQLSDAVRRKKQCITQQIDYEQEQYLFAHVGPQLFGLHEEIMADGQWQAYEFEQALWYYHAPTARLYAEHPMRSSGTTRRLIGAVQLTTRFAAQKLQRAARVRLRRSALVRAVVGHPALLEEIWYHVWQQAWTRLQEEKRELLTVACEQQALVIPAEPGAPAAELSAAEVVKHGIPRPAAARVASEERAVAAPDSSLAKAIDMDPGSSRAGAADAPRESEILPTPLNEAPQRTTEPALVQGAATLTTRHSYEEWDRDDDDDESVEWRGYLTLLKSNLQQKRSSPPKHWHSRRQQPPHQHPHDRRRCAQRDFQEVTRVSVETQTQTQLVDDTHESSIHLPRMHHAGASAVSGGQWSAYHPAESASSPKRVGSSIAPPMQDDVVAPFMFNTHQHAGRESECALPLSSSHFEPVKVRLCAHVCAVALTGSLFRHCVINWTAECRPRSARADLAAPRHRPARSPRRGVAPQRQLPRVPLVLRAEPRRPWREPRPAPRPRDSDSERAAAAGARLQPSGADAAEGAHRR
ncbi:hypothetical protein PybrP1_004390 [[Pythium] brassicae (nom. inval.)]|nr:hypothetical protein PybrP1_004390 [[Pythium] brassicae (nom. inval.)]